jgi:diphthine-ammonia ligase
VVVVVHGDVAREALAQLGGVGFGSGDGELAAVVRYVDAAAFTVVDGEGVEGIGPVVPCQSLWGGEGERLAAVTVYQSVFE